MTQEFFAEGANLYEKQYDFLHLIYLFMVEFTKHYGGGAYEL